MNQSLRCQIIRHEALDDRQKAMIADWAKAMFTRYPGEPQEWAAPNWHMMLILDGEMVSHAAITERQITVGEQKVQVAGVGAVMTPASYQRRGFAEQVMNEAARFICDSLNVDFGLLTCFERFVPYYQKLGWQQLKVPYFFQQSTGCQRWLYEAMCHPAGRSEWPSGDIDIQGRPW